MKANHIIPINLVKAPFVQPKDAKEPLMVRKIHFFKDGTFEGVTTEDGVFHSYSEFRE